MSKTITTAELVVVQWLRLFVFGSTSSPFTVLYCTVLYCTVLYCKHEFSICWRAPSVPTRRHPPAYTRFAWGWSEHKARWFQLKEVAASVTRLAVYLGRSGLFTTNCSLEYKYIKYILNWLQKSQPTQPSVISQHISILLWVLLNEGIPFRKNYLSIFFSPLKRSGSPNLITKRVSPLMGRILSWAE